MRSVNTLLSICAVAALAGTPASAFASVEISELMYDAPGTDSGHEWIEMANIGSSPVDISGYKLFEGNTNHALTLISGSAVLPPQSAAVIAEDAAKFSADWPGFSGTLLKASFSLSNSGESLALKDDSLDAVDEAAYDASAGAAGDGNSLHRSGEEFIAGAADPGVYSENIPPAIAAEVPASEPATTPAVSAVPNVPAITVKIAADATVITGAGSFFTANAYDAKGERVADARFLWNFGDGETAEGQNIFHTYAYPGKYSVALSVGSQLSAALSKMVVTAVPAQVAFMVEADGSAVLVNRSGMELSVGLWSITSGTTTFVIPENTSILAGQAIHFSTSVMHLYAGQDAQLQYPNGTIAVAALARSAPSDLTPAIADAIPQRTATMPRPVPAPVVLTRSAQPVPVAQPQPVPATQPILAAQEEPVVTAAAAQALPLGLSAGMLEGGLGLFTLVVLGIASIWYSQSLLAPREEHAGDGVSFTDEFDIDG